MSTITCILLAQQQPAPAEDGSAPFVPWPLFIILALVAYLMLFRPERRQRAQREAMLKLLKKNDRVVTIGGIYGTVVNAPEGSDDVVLRVDEGSNVRLKVQRSAIARILTDKPEAEDKSPQDKK